MPSRFDDLVIIPQRFLFVNTFFKSFLWFFTFFWNSFLGFHLRSMFCCFCPKCFKLLIVRLEKSCGINYVIKSHVCESNRLRIFVLIIFLIQIVLLTKNLQVDDLQKNLQIFCYWLKKTIDFCVEKKYNKSRYVFNYILFYYFFCARTMRVAKQPNWSRRNYEKQIQKNDGYRFEDCFVFVCFACCPACRG